MSRVADMHVPPALRRWGIRVVLAIVVAASIGYLPAEIVHQDPRAAKLEAQLEELDKQAAELRDDNQALAHQIRALRTDVRAIEDHARADLGMVYPDEIVVHVYGVAP